MDSKKPTSDGASALDTARTTFAIVSDLENPIATATDIVTGLSMIAETLDRQEGSVVQRLSWLVLKQLELIEEERGKLFHLAHAQVYGPSKDNGEEAA